MEIFQYQFLGPGGKRKSSFIHAHNVAEAKEKLRAQNIMILSLSSGGKKETLFFKKKGPYLKQDSLIAFTTQLTQLLKAGMPLYESLLSLEEQYRAESFHPILATICERIKSGSSLSQAISQFPKSFSTLYTAMVAAGESIGELDITLDRLSILLIKQRKLKKMVGSALLYPAILFSFSLFVIAALFCFVIPSLEVLFEDRDVNRFTRLVMSCSHFFTQKWWLYVPVLAGLSFGLVTLFTKASWKDKAQRKMLKVPILRRMMIETAMARFCRTMGTLLQGGVSIIHALQIARRVMNNSTLEEVVEMAEAKIIEGSILSAELKKSPFIPTFVPRMLAIGEEGGNAALMLHKVADFYEEEIEKTVTRFTTLLQPIILIAMGTLVGVIMLAVLLPLTDVSAFL